MLNILLWVLLTFGAFPVAAQNLVIAQSWWADPSGHASFEQAHDQHYLPYEGMLLRGYVTDATWIKLRLHQQTGNPRDTRIILSVAPMWLDEVTLYDPLEPSASPRQVGDRTDYALQEYPLVGMYAFSLPIGKSDRDVWLRLQTRSTSVIQLQALGESAMLSQSSITLWMACGLCMFTGIALAFLVTLWIQEPDWLTLGLSLRVGIYFLLILCHFGFFRVFLHRWLAPEWLDNAFSFLLICATSLSVYLEQTLLRKWVPKPWADKALHSMQLWSVVNVLLFLAGYVQPALQLNTLANFCCTLVFLMCSLFGLQRRHSESFGMTAKAALRREWLMLYWVVLFTLSVLSALPILGVRSSVIDGLVGSGFIVYGLVSGTLMTGLLSWRVFVLRQLMQSRRLQLALLQQQNDFERTRREEQRRFLTLLMHEIKNPLSVIEMAQHKANEGYEDVVQQNLRAIRHVLDRSLLFEKFDDDHLMFHKRVLPLGDCLAEVMDEANLDEQRFEFVHLIDGEQCVRTDAECLRLMLTNLLGNALKYSSPADKIKVEVVYDDDRPDQLGIAVSNRVGLAGRPDPDKVFQKYYRGSAAHAIPGTGLGLYLIGKLAEQLGGECRYVPDLEFVRFELWLPV